MKSLNIRNLPLETLSALKRLAESHHRSLQGEIHFILEQAARMAPPEQLQPLSLVTVRTGRTSTWNREEIYGDSGR